MLLDVIGAGLGAWPGAELVGRVRQAGSLASQLAGQVVLVPRFLPCGDCPPCARGRVALCHAPAPRPSRPPQEAVVPAKFLLPLMAPFVPIVEGTVAADNLWPYAVLADALLAPYAGLCQAGFSPGTLTLILGNDARASLAAVVVSALGGRPVLVGQWPEPLHAALALSPYAVSAVLCGDTLDAEALLAQAKDQTQSHVQSAPPCIIETTGSTAGRTRALSLLAHGGAALLLDRAQPLDAPPASPPLFDAGPQPHALSFGALLDLVTRRGATVIGAAHPHPDLLIELCALLSRAQVSLETLVRPVAEHDVDAVYLARRCGQDDPLRLPVVRWPLP